MADPALPFSPLRDGPLLGEVGRHDAFIWVRGHDSSPLLLTLFEKSVQKARFSITPKSEHWHCAVFRLTDLDEDTGYEYIITGARGLAGRWKFRTAPSESARRARIAFGSCLQEPDSSAPALQGVALQKPDLWLMIGDNAYFPNADVSADLPTVIAEANMMRWHVHFRRARGLSALTSSTPTLAIWDDHDFGPNNSGRGYAHKEAALRCFRRMWANRRFGLPDAPGIFSTVRYGPVQLFLTDARFRRGSGHMLDRAQLDWLKDRLAASDAPVKLVVSSSQVLASGSVKKEWDSWRRTSPDELQELLAFIDENNIQGVVFLSGDVHLGYLFHQPGRPRRGGLTTADKWELTASPICGPIWHERILHGDNPVFDPGLLTEVESQNFGIIDIDLDRTGAEVHLISHARISVSGVFPPFLLQPVPLRTLSARRTSPDKLTALWWPPNGKLYFFRGRNYVRYDFDKRRPDPGYPREINGNWPSIEPHLDAAVAWPDGTADFFHGNGFQRLLASSKQPIGGPHYTARLWKGLPLSFRVGVDAVLHWPNGKVYIFQGERYLRFGSRFHSLDEGYPKSIAQNWPGLWKQGVETGFVAPDGKAYFFRGGEYIRYDIDLDRADPDFPKPVEPDWPGLPE